MPALDNPFPGMNPYLQEYWSDVHTMLIAYIRDALSEKLPPDLAARAEEHIEVMDEEKPRNYRADVAIRESWRDGFPPVWNPPGEPGSGETVVADPLVFITEAPPERWVEIRDTRGELVTVIEVISPGNKVEENIKHYRKRQEDFLRANVGLVEIDLIRGGWPVVAIHTSQLKFPPGTCHLVCVSRPTFGDLSRREVYLCPLREPLPTIRVPLRRGDPDVPLALQLLINRCYRTGRYWLTDYARAPHPPVAAEDRAWVEERVQAAGLRGNSA